MWFDCLFVCFDDFWLLLLVLACLRCLVLVLDLGGFVIMFLVVSYYC